MLTCVADHHTAGTPTPCPPPCLCLPASLQAVVQAEGMDLPNGGMTFASQHNAEKSDDAANLWSWEFGAYNVENVGLTTVHNLKVGARHQLPLSVQSPVRLR